MVNWAGQGLKLGTVAAKSKRMISLIIQKNYFATKLFWCDTSISIAVPDQNIWWGITFFKFFFTVA